MALLSHKNYNYQQFLIPYILMILSTIIISQEMMFKLKILIDVDYIIKVIVIKGNIQTVIHY